MSIKDRDTVKGFVTRVDLKRLIIADDPRITGLEM